MIRVDQTLFGDGAGNCLPACIATLTGFPLGKVPNFCEENADGDWYADLGRWLKTRGLSPLSLLFETPEQVEAHMRWAREFGARTPWIAGGETDRGRHFCVYVGERLFHDPNPNYRRQGLSRVTDATFLLRAAD